jgi:tripartite-type tricarboxylate transporter receptor subunit TctC
MYTAGGRGDQMAGRSLLAFGLGTVLGTALGCTLLASAVRADGVADFYRGRTINVLIGVNVGGGYDFEARLLARFMRAHIPGNPLLVPQNVIGAGGIKMANYLYAVAPQDGTAIGMFPNTLVAAQAVATEGVQYDANKFFWLGSIGRSPITLAAWHTSGIQTIADARAREIVAAASNKGAITYTFPHMMNELLGTRFKIVSGYQGNSTMTVAMERGEVEAVTNSWDSWKSFNPAWISERKIRLLVQTEPKSKELPDVPSVQELARSADDRKVIQLIVSGDALGKPLAAAPNVPPDRARALRAAFEATLKDPEFVTAAKAAGIEIDPVHGAELAGIVANVLATPRSLAERARAIIAE